MNNTLNSSLRKTIAVRQVHGFPGGIHPPEHKNLSNQTSIQIATLPPYLRLPLSQTPGISANPIVKAGDKVLAGQCIATSDNWMGLPVHASTSGTVIGIETHTTHHPSGIKEPCIIIEVDGQDTWITLKPLDHTQCDAKTIVQRVWSSGICGAGGAGFPSHVKLSPKQGTLKTLIVNAMECEPYITADDVLMREKATQIIEGIEIVAHLLQCHEVLIGIEENKPAAFRALKQAIGNRHYDIVVVPTKYPSGGEKQTIQLLTGLEVPSGKIPADLGMVCLNVGTLSAIADAVVRGRPMVNRITTLTGQALNNPGNFEALIGTPIECLLDQAKVRESELYRLVLGGPMMGFTVNARDIPIAKTSNCILAATQSELPPPLPEQPCIRCGECALACPASLLPQQLYWFSKSGEYDKAQHHNIMDCIECGACSYVCPSKIPLVQYYRHTKGVIRQQRLDRIKSDQARERFESRNARLERDRLEKEARKANRQAASKTKTKVPKTSPHPNAEIALKANMDKREKQWRDAKAAFDEATKGTLDTSILDQMRVKIDSLKSAYDVASVAWQKERKGQPISTPEDTVQLTIKSAIAKTEIKKIERALNKLDESATQHEREVLRSQLQAATEEAKLIDAALEHTKPTS